MTCKRGIITDFQTKTMALTPNGKFVSSLDTYPNVTITDNGIESKKPITLHTNRYGAELKGSIPFIIWQGYFKYNNNKGYNISVERSSDGFFLSVNRLGEGYIEVTFNNSFKSRGDYFVTAMGISREKTGSLSHVDQSYVCITEQKEVNGFIMAIADDDSLNDYDIYVTIWTFC